MTTSLRILLENKWLKKSRIGEALTYESCVAPILKKNGLSVLDVKIQHFRPSDFCVVRIFYVPDFVWSGLEAGTVCILCKITQPSNAWKFECHESFHPAKCIIHIPSLQSSHFECEKIYLFFNESNGYWISFGWQRILLAIKANIQCMIRRKLA